MFDIDFTFLWTAVNLAILYFFVNKFLFKKLGGFMSDRSKAIADDMEKAETSRREGEEFHKQRQDLLSEAYGEKRRIIEESKTQASKEYDGIIKKAKEDAERIMTEAREETERERARLKKELRRDVAALAVAAASKIIKANMDNEKNRSMVDEFLSDEGAA